MKKCAWCLDHGAMERYHDEEWGTVLKNDDRRQFEYLLMEAMQCGLSWALMIKKREIFRECFAEFDFHAVAQFGEEDVQRILETPGMIRSAGKIRAIIGNARCFLKVIGEWGSFSCYLWHFTNGKTRVYRSHLSGNRETKNALSDEVARDLKRRGFKYLGSVTVYSHLQSCGMILDHEPDCFRFREILDSADVEYVE